MAERSQNGASAEHGSNGSTDPQPVPDGKQLAKRGRGRYTTQEIERSLTAVALCQGNTRRAATALKAEGLPVPRSTLKYWATNLHKDRYLVISNEESRHLYARLADNHEALAERLIAVNEKAVSELERKLSDQDASLGEISNTVRNISVSAGIHQDKGSLIRGRPTEIRSTLSAAEILKIIKERWGEHIFKTIDSTAEELNDAPPLEDGTDHV